MSFILTKRAESPNYYVVYKCPVTGEYGTKKSTGVSDRKQAEKIAYQWLYKGLPKHKRTPPGDAITDSIKYTDLTIDDAQSIIDVLIRKNLIVSAIFRNTKADMLLIDYLNEFWDIDKSNYIKERQRKHHKLSARYITKQTGAIKNYWEPYFKDMKLGSITREDINNFIDHMGNLTSPASMNGKNCIIKAGTVPLRWAFNNDYIAKDITQNLTFYSGVHKKREILTPELVIEIFKAPWENDVSKLANLLAMCTGMRAGEILGLRIQDLGEDRLHIRHSWSYDDGLKTPKNGESRIAEIVFPHLMNALVAQAKSNPHNDGLEGHIFYSILPGRPMDSKSWLRDLREICRKIGIQDPSWVTFHGWRHFYTTYMHGNVKDRVLQMATGHKCHAMLEHYANHEREIDTTELRIAQKEVFAPILAEALSW